MGRRIDRIILTVLTASALYLLFLNASGSIAAGLIMTFLAITLMRRLAGRFPGSPFAIKRRAAARARDYMEYLALTDKENAESQIRQLLKRAYPDISGTFPIECILRHPAGSQVSADDVTRIWRTLRGADRALIAALPPADPQAADLVSRLRCPEICLIDGGMLLRIAAANPLPDIRNEIPAARTPSGSRFARMARAFGRANSGKCIVTGILMCLLFCITGAAAYLTGGIILIYISFISLRKRRMPEVLFEK